MAVVVELDGSRTNEYCLAPQVRVVIDHCRLSPKTSRSFIFSQGQLVGMSWFFFTRYIAIWHIHSDDDELSVESSDLAGLGMIKLTFHEGKIGEKIQREYFPDVKIPEQRRIPERGKKGIQACVG